MREPGRGLYVLDESGEKPVRCDDIEAWANWFENANRRVATTLLGGAREDPIDGKMFISTVFLGVDHSGLSDVPVLWETMVFRIMDRQIGDSLDYDRCTGTREQALAMHESMCTRVDALLNLGVELKA